VFKLAPCSCLVCISSWAAKYLVALSKHKLLQVAFHRSVHEVGTAWRQTPEVVAHCKWVGSAASQHLFGWRFFQSTRCSGLLGMAFRFAFGQQGRRCLGAAGLQGKVGPWLRARRRGTLLLLPCLHIRRGLVNIHRLRHSLHHGIMK